MPQTLLNFAASERVDLSDMQALSQAQPVAMASQLAGTLLSRSNANSEMWILHGFAVQAGVQANPNSPAANQLSVSPGSGLLAWRQGGASPTYGVLAALDGTDQQAQGIDLSLYPGGSYAVWVRLNYSQAAMGDRTFWNAAEPGFEYSKLTPTQLVATWEVQALAAGANPGAEWLKVATLTWTAPSTQGGAGTIAALTDVRPLYFEGNPAATPPYAGTWGSGNDRNADRSTYGIHDLRTMVDALKTCIEDIKGPGLRRWWSPDVGGMNLGFVPNTPTRGRMALGDAGFYLQGRTAATAGHAYLVTSVGSSGQLTGWDFASDRTRYLVGGNPLLTYSTYGTAGFGNLVETDLFAAPGRSVVEMVCSASGQAALRLGARAYNNQVPCNLDAVLTVAAPDQTGNLAQIKFATGGVQGPEKLLYQAGKGVNNHFHLYDFTNNVLFLDYDYTTRSLVLGGGAFSFYDSTNGISALSYAPTTRQVSVTAGLSAGGLISGGALQSLGGATVVQGLTVGGAVQFNGSANVSGSLTAGSLNTGGSATISGGVSVGNSLSAGGGLNGSILQVAGLLLAAQGNLQVPTGLNPPSNPATGALFCRTGNNVKSYNRLYVYLPTYVSDQGGNGDDLPQGWVRIQVG